MNEEERKQSEAAARATDQVRALSSMLGRQPTACVVTFGCQMNARDSEKLSGILESVGYALVDNEDADLLIIESDVLIRRETIARIRTARQDRVGLIAAITHDEQDRVNFPYRYAKLWRPRPTFTIKRFSFCCTLLTCEFLQTFPFDKLNPEKDWFDVTISHKSLEYGFRNLLLMDTPVLHKPHSSRPWKMLKYTNPIKYYFLKFLHSRDKI